MRRGRREASKNGAADCPAGWTRVRSGGRPPGRQAAFARRPAAAFLLRSFPMKRIAICFDGTWNKPADENLAPATRIETNVSRFFDSIRETAADGARQVRWYDQGVGTHFYDRFTGAALGMGLELNILEGYKFLAETYEDDDHIYVLGFSRGAYTARSLVGMIRNCGLVMREHLALKAPIAYGIYRTRDDGPDSTIARAFRRGFAREAPIRFVGVWDTVGALGI